MQKMFTLFMLWAMVLLIAACTSSEADPTPTSAPPSPTPLPMLDEAAYSGPLIGRIGGGIGETAQTECDDACMVDLGVVLGEISAEARPLTTYEIDGLEIGIPEGYSPLELPNETLIAADSAETAGRYSFGIRQMQSEDLPALLARFGDVDLLGTGELIDHPSLMGRWLPTGDYGAIAWLALDDERGLFIEAAAAPAYWPYFEATFQAMLASLKPLA